MERLLRSGPLAYGTRARQRNRAAALLLATLAIVTPLLANAQTVTIAALGDSLTQGYGLPQGAGFVAQLESWLTGRGHDVTLVNAGVSGDTTAGGLSRIDWTLTPEVDALIVALGGNDLLRGLDPANSRANLDAILARADAAGIPTLLIGMKAPGNYGPEYKQAFDAMYPELARAHGALWVDNFLGALTDLPDRGQTLASYMQADGIHPNAEGVKLIVADIGPHVESLIARVTD